MSKKIRILLGIDEDYTRQAVVDCFKNRNEYEIIMYDKKNSKQSESLDNLDYDVLWLEYEYLDFEKLTQANLIEIDKRFIFNSYCIRKGLIRKAHIAYYIKKYCLKHPESPLSRHVPETCVFELDYIDYLDEALNDAFEVELELEENKKRLDKNQKTKKFILKSSMTNKGVEMLIFDKRVQLEEFFRKRIEYLDENDENYDGSLDLREWVIQKYIDNPLLLEPYKHRKFHLRVYVVAVGNLKVYVYESILALFSLKSYNESDLHEQNLISHITNTCFQYEATCKDNLTMKFNESDCVKEFWSLEIDVDKKNHIFSQIKQVVAGVFECLSCERIVFQPLENAFELYGLDFIVDSNYNVFFLEANAFPDFKQTGKNLNDLISNLFYQTIALTIDRYFSIASVCNTSKMHLVYQNK